MKRSLVGLLAVVLLALVPAAPAVAQLTCELQVTCSVESLGDDLYRITYILTNASPESDALFKWSLGTPGIQPEWLPVALEAPEGWNATHHEKGRLDFETPNGDGDPHRLHSASALACTGPHTLTFRWTLDRNGGPVPDCAGLDGEDFFVHVQGLDPATCLNVGDSYVCPNVVPETTLTWGAIKARFGD